MLLPVSGCRFDNTTEWPRLSRWAIRPAWRPTPYEELEWHWPSGRLVPIQRGSLRQAKNRRVQEIRDEKHNKHWNTIGKNEKRTFECDDVHTYRVLNLHSSNLAQIIQNLSFL